MAVRIPYRHPTPFDVRRENDSVSPAIDYLTAWADRVEKHYLAYPRSRIYFVRRFAVRTPQDREREEAQAAHRTDRDPSPTIEEIEHRLDSIIDRYFHHEIEEIEHRLASKEIDLVRLNRILGLSGNDEIRGAPGDSVEILHYTCNLLVTNLLFFIFSERTVSGRLALSRPRVFSTENFDRIRHDEEWIHLLDILDELEPRDAWRKLFAHLGLGAYVGIRRVPLHKASYGYLVYDREHDHAVQEFLDRLQDLGRFLGDQVLKDGNLILKPIFLKRCFASASNQAARIGFGIQAYAVPLLGEGWGQWSEISLPPTWRSFGERIDRAIEEGFRGDYFGVLEGDVRDRLVKFIRYLLGQRWGIAYLGLDVGTGGSSGSPKSRPSKPKWDEKNRTLHYGETLCRLYKTKARNQFRILRDFEAQGWPTSIPNPWGEDADLLMQTIKDLNAGMKDESRIRFAKINLRIEWRAE
jgi:hypothetical protein